MGIQIGKNRLLESCDIVKLINVDRFLLLIKNRYSYSRRVPSDVMDLDKRSPKIKISLRTNDLAKARSIRDRYERLDDELWEALRAAKYATNAQEQYSASRTIHSTLDLKHMSRQERENDDREDIADGKIMNIPLAAHNLIRTEERGLDMDSPIINTAMLDALEKPAMLFSEVVTRYIELLETDAWLCKSQGQQDSSRKPIRIAERYFVDVCGDLPFGDIERRHGVKMYDFLRMRMKAKELGWSMCNSILGNLRRI